MAPPITVMATRLPEAFSREMLFFFESSVDLIQTCTQCSPGMDVSRVSSYFMVIFSFQVPLALIPSLKQVARFN